MASKTKIYIVLEFVDGGELFDKIVSLFFQLSLHSWFYTLTLHVLVCVHAFLSLRFKHESSVHSSQHSTDSLFDSLRPNMGGLKRTKPEVTSSS